MNYYLRLFVDNYLKEIMKPLVVIKKGPACLRKNISGQSNNRKMHLQIRSRDFSSDMNKSLSWQALKQYEWSKNL